MANIGDMLGKALSVGGSMLGSAAAGPIGAAIPLLGSVAGNVLSGINQRSARKWEEDMYNQYNSPSALVRQYQEAGINPALMFGGQSPAAPTDTSAAPVVEPQTGSVTEMLAQLMQLDMLDAEKRIKRASAEKLEAETAGQNIENQYRPQLLDQSLRKGDLDIEQARYGIAQSIATINNIEADTLNKEEQQFLIKAQKELAIAQQVLASTQSKYVSLQSIEQEFSNKVFKDTGSPAGTSLWNMFPGVVARSEEELSKFGRWLKKQFTPSDPTNGPISR